MNMSKKNVKLLKQNLQNTISKQTKNQICAYYSKLRPDDIGHLVVGLNLLEVDESGDYTRYYLYDPKEMISDLEEELSQLKQLTTKHI